VLHYLYVVIICSLLHQLNRLRNPNILFGCLFIFQSSLGTAADKTNYSLQLLNVYQQYPDKWLRAAINKLRNDQIVSSKKLFARNLKKSKNSHIPLTSTPFQLAMYYFHMMQSKYQYELFSETWSALQSLCGAGATGVNLDVVADSGGRTACVLEGAVAGLVSLQIQIPAQILMLDFDPTIYEEEKKQLEEVNLLYIHFIIY
jgi:hypothetical protein